MLNATPDALSAPAAPLLPQPLPSRPGGAGAPSGGSTEAPQGLPTAPQTGALIAKGELQHPPPEDGCCGSTIELLNERTGQLVTSRCKATNRCPRCARRFARETTEMLILDAVEWAPTLWMVLTAREHLTRKEASAHLQHLRRVTRKRWPHIEWFVQVEFQTPRQDWRRGGEWHGVLHLNLIIKGVDVGDRQQLWQVIAGEWVKRVDAELPGQWCGEIADYGGLAKYLAKVLGHGLKSQQAPPIGWKGHRTSQSRGYFPGGAADLRQRARESLRRQDITRAQAALGHRGHALEQAVEQELAAAEDASWIAYAPHLLNHPGWVASRREALRGGDDDGQDQALAFTHDQEAVDPSGSQRPGGRVWALPDRPAEPGDDAAHVPDMWACGPLDLPDQGPNHVPRLTAAGGRTEGERAEGVRPPRARRPPGPPPPTPAT